jgi:hypothetical protein
MPAGLSTAREWFEWLSLLVAVGVLLQLAIESAIRKRAGQVLLDLGRIYASGSGRMFVAGALYLALGLVSLFFTPRRFYGLAFVVLGVNQFVTAAQHFQLRRAGILGRGFWGSRLFRWEDIASYELDRSGGLNLKPRGKDWVRPRGRISPDYRQDVEALLKSHCPKAENRVEA